MTTKWFFSPASVFSTWMRFVVGAALVSALPAKADDDPGPPTGNVNVVYNPNATQSVQGDEPLHFEYNLSITSPGVLPNANHAIHMKAVVISAPAGVSHATAEGFVTFSQPNLTFTAPNQTISVTVTLDVPVGSSTGDFSYKIIAQGWPGLLGIIDAGTFINMHVDPPSGLEPPTVSITKPTDGSAYTYVLGGPAVSVPVEVIGSASEAAPVTELRAYLSGVDEDGNNIFNGVDSSGQPVHYVVVDLLTTNLGTPTARGQAVLALTVAGQYTLSATATNVMGMDDTAVDFTINEEVPPPTVVINPPTNNPTYSYIRGISSTTVPYQFVASTLKGGIQAISATLDGNPISPTLTPLGQLEVTGTGSFVFDASVAQGPGQHTIAVTATDIYGSQASDAQTFVIREDIPQISINITAPVDGTTIPLPPDASALNLPFSFTSSVTLGGTVKTISATLTKDDADPISIILTSQSGLDTPTATGSCTLLNLTPGTYTLSATGANSSLGLEAFDSVTFVVTPPPPPTIVFTQAPGPSYTTLTGVPLSIPFAIKTSSTGAYIRVQSVTLDGEPVANLTSTANGTALVATGGATLSIPAPSAGTTTHTLTATGTDVYDQTVTTDTTFKVTVNDPVIAIAINPEIAANSPYTLPYSGSITIPFTFTGTITSGATVDTITGDLGGTPVTITSTTGLGTSSTATASGNLIISAPGTYTVTATDTNTASGLSATTSVTFVVKKTEALPPLTVQITQPPQPSYTLTRLNSCDPLRIPITFVGTSTGGTVKTMTATLDGKPISLSSLTGLGTGSSTGKATLTVTTVGTHVLVVKDTDALGQTATASATFTVVVKQPEIAIVIDKPANNAVYTLPTGSGWCGTDTLSIPFSFTATISAGSTIDSISASLNGSALSFSKSGIGTSTAKGYGTLKVSRTGTYTLTAKGVDTTTGATATTSVTFTVRQPAPPSVTITQPTQTSYTVYSNCSPVSVAFAFKATSESSAGIKKLTATLDGCWVNVTSSGLGRQTATGSGTMALKSAGKHVLKVTATDGNGSASATLVLNVTVATPTVNVKITNPENGQTFSYDDGDPAPRIPFSIEATTSSGATISSLKAALNSCNVNVSNNGIGSSSVKGTGYLSVDGPGTYTLTATAISGGVSATTKITFTVKKNPAPNCSVEWTGDVGHNKRVKGGKKVAVSCGLKRGENGGYVRDDSVTFSVCEVKSNGSYGRPKYYDASDCKVDRRTNEYSFDCDTDSGTRRYRIEAYCFPKGSKKPKLAGSKEFKTQ